MSKKIIFIMGSPHLNGNVSVAMDTLKANGEKSGAACVQYNLCKLNIKNCLGCRKCVENGGICVIDDEMKTIFEDIKTADTVVIGSPIYICQVNGITKTFLDRLYPLTDEHHKPRFGKKKLIMLYTYGAPIPFVFNKYIKYTGKSLKAMGLIIKKNIIIQGCTTIDKIKKDDAILQNLQKYGGF